MGTAIKRVTVTHRHEYRVPAPAAHVEVEKALHWATQDFEDVRGRAVQYDDDLWVVGDEESVTVYFEVVGDPARKDSSGVPDAQG